MLTQKLLSIRKDVWHSSSCNRVKIVSILIFIGHCTEKIAIPIDLICFVFLEIASEDVEELGNMIL